MRVSIGHSSFLNHPLVFEARRSKIRSTHLWSFTLASNKFDFVARIYLWGKGSTNLLAKGYLSAGIIKGNELFCQRSFRKRLEWNHYEGKQLRFPRYTHFFLYKNIVFPSQAEYSYFSADFSSCLFCRLPCIYITCTVYWIMLASNRGARMGFYCFISWFFRLEKERLTVFTSFQHKIIFFSKSQPRVYS